MMQEDFKDISGILQFQQSLLRLVTREGKDETKNKAVTAEQTRQLEDWVRKVRPEAS